MTLDQANATAKMFDGMGFSRVEVSEFGFATGNYEVYLWSINPKAGNRTAHLVKHPVSDPMEAKLIGKVAKGKANDRDKAALTRIAAERTV